MKTKTVKPDPAKDALKWPYLLRKKYADDRFYRTWKDARAAIVKELSDLKDGFKLVGWADSIDAVGEVLARAERLWPERAAVVEGVVDPSTGQRYRCELQKREQL